MSIVLREFDGLGLPFRASDSYVNATALAKAYSESTGKRREPGDWLRLKRTEETLNYVASVTGIPVTELVQVIQGRFAGQDVREQGTFLHPDLAIPFASWLSVEFEYKVTKIVQQRLVEESSSQISEQINTLQQLVDTMKVYLEAAQGLNRTIHTAIHNQSLPINRALQEVESYIQRYRPK
jgi:hypothetical protein